MKRLIPILLFLFSTSSLLFSQGTYIGVTKAGCSCHNPVIDAWETTGHAIAQDSVSSAYYGYDCLQCHNTGWDPNTVNGGADEFVVKDTTQSPNYVITDQTNWDKMKNVQCEACHGTLGAAGGGLDFTHTSGTRVTDFSAENCGSCHQGAHHPYLEEWGTSAHAESEVAFFTRANNGDCYYCHYAQDFVASLTDAEYDGTTFSPDGGVDNVLTCVTCHDPHGNENVGNLRNYAENKIICDACHTAHIEEVDINSTPHHTTSEVLDGSPLFGYQYPNETYTNSIHTVATPDRCADCHVHSGGDGEYGSATGHTFEPRVEACEVCHADYTSVVDTSNHDTRFDYRGTQTRIKDLMATLKDNLDNASSEDSATVAFNESRYNYDAINAEGSYGIHNTKLVEKLLTDAIAGFTPTNVEVLEGLPLEYQLGQNYPNPFNPSTTVSFGLPENSDVQITVYDMVGNKVEVLVNDNLNAGYYTYNWNAANYASGIYFCQMTAGKFTSVQKMLLIK